MSWGYTDIVENAATTEPVVEAPVVAPAAETAAAEPAPATVDNSKELQDKIAEAATMIQSYSGYPGVAGAFASMVTANAQNPERLAALVSEMVDQIEQVRSNPHVSRPVNGNIAQVIEAVRAVELEKPDPLNLLRGDQQASQQNSIYGQTEEEKKREEEKVNPLSIVGAIVGGAVAVTAVKSAGAAEFGLATDQTFAVKDMGSTSAALAAAINGFTPTPGVGTPQRDAGLGFTV